MCPEIEEEMRAGIDTTSPDIEEVIRAGRDITSQQIEKEMIAATDTTSPEIGIQRFLTFLCLGSHIYCCQIAVFLQTSKTHLHVTCTEG